MYRKKPYTIYKKPLSFSSSMSVTLSSYDLSHLVRELQVLVGAKIEKIFQQPKPQDDFLFSFHVPNKGKQYVFVTLPSALCLSDFKPDFPSMPPTFCSSLRRKISNARVESVSQYEFQRIIVFELSTKMGKSTLVIELFSQGNMILLDETNTILAVLHRKIWNEQRKILHGQVYQFPEQELNPKTISLEEFSKALQSSSKDSLVTFLAIDVGLGGVYAEYLLRNASLEKETSPKEFENVQELYDALQLFLSKDTAPVLVQEKVYPIAIEDGQALNSYNAGIASLLLKNLEAQEKKDQTKDHKQSLSKVDKVLSSQIKQRDGLLKSVEQNQEAGETIYNHYQELQEVLTFIQQNKKMSWAQIKEELKKYPFIISVDEHKGELQVEFK